MSNLYKFYNTSASAENVRMIDYNSLVGKKLAELAKQQDAGSEPEGFRGLNDVTEEVVKEDPQEVLQKAKEEAETILNEAKEEAESALLDAKAKSEEMYRQAKENGHTEGYEAGFSQAKEELEAEYSQKREALERQRQEYSIEHDREMRELEPKLLDVIVTVVERVFHIQFDDKKEILLYLIGNAIANIEGCKSFRIRVGTEQRDFLDTHKEEILDRVGHDMSLEIVSDLTLEVSQCVIETDTGIFDCSLGAQLENLIKDLRSLSS